MEIGLLAAFVGAMVVAGLQIAHWVEGAAGKAAAGVRADPGERWKRWSAGAERAASVGGPLGGILDTLAFLTRDRDIQDYLRVTGISEPGFRVAHAAFMAVCLAAGALSGNRDALLALAGIGVLGPSYGVKLAALYRRMRLQAAFPFFLDMFHMALSAGRITVQDALKLLAPRFRWPLRQELRLMVAIAETDGPQAAFAAFAQRLADLPEAKSFVEAMAAAIENHTTEEVYADQADNLRAIREAAANARHSVAGVIREVLPIAGFLAVLLIFISPMLGVTIKALALLGR